MHFFILTTLYLLDYRLKEPDKLLGIFPVPTEDFLTFSWIVEIVALFVKKHISQPLRAAARSDWDVIIAVNALTERGLIMVHCISRLKKRLQRYKFYPNFQQIFCNILRLAATYLFLVRCIRNGFIEKKWKKLLRGMVKFVSLRCQKWLIRYFPRGVSLHRHCPN